MPGSTWNLKFILKLKWEPESIRHGEQVDKLSLLKELKTLSCKRIL
jgi:hypothetical protein